MNETQITQESRRYTFYTQLLNGTVTISGLVVIGLIMMKPERFAEPDWVIWLLVVIGGMHTFEEYTFPGGFTRWFNLDFFNSGHADSPLSAKKAFFVDGIAGLIIVLILTVLGTNMLWLTLGLACLFFINGSWHLTISMTKGVYSPGAISSALFNVPLAAYIVYFYYVGGYASLSDVLLAYGIGLTVHTLFFGMIRRGLNQNAKGLNLASM